MKKIFKTLVFLIIICVVAIFLLKKIYPLKYSDIITTYSVNNNTDPFMTMAIIKAESNFDENATSHKNAKGLMQITDETASWCHAKMGITSAEINLYDVETNIKTGTWFYAYLLDKFGSERVALAAYNAGTGNVSKWLMDPSYSKDGENITKIPFVETEVYVEKVLTNYKIYKFLYGKEGGSLNGIGIQIKERLGISNN